MKNSPRRIVGITMLGLLTVSVLAVGHERADASTSALAKKYIFLNSKMVSMPYGFVSNNTTYMPIWYVQTALKQAGISSTWNGKVWNIKDPDVSVSRKAVGGAGSKTIELNGIPVYRVNDFVMADPYSRAQTEYMPIQYVQSLLSTVHIRSDWNGVSWNMYTAGYQPHMPQNQIMGFSYDSASEVADANVHKQILDAVDMDNYDITPTGTLSGSTPVKPGDPAVGVVTNWSGDNFSNSVAASVLNSPGKTSTLITNIVALARSQNFSGINIDFENLASAECGPFEKFLAQLQAQLHVYGKTLSVDVPAETGPTVNAWTAAYNYKDISLRVDEVDIMTYDYTYINQAPGPVAPLWWDQQVLKYATSIIPSTKIMMGLAAYGYNWSAPGKGMSMDLKQIDDLLAKDKVQVQWDGRDESPYFIDKGHTVYYENEKSIASKINLVKSYHIRGVFFWHISTADTSFWNTLSTY